VTKIRQFAMETRVYQESAVFVRWGNWLN